MGSVGYYDGIEGVVINPQTPQELYDVIDVIHSQTMVMELPESTKHDVLLILEKCMDDLVGLIPGIKES